MITNIIDAYSRRTMAGATVAAFMITRQHTKSPSISANKWVALLV